METGKNKLVKGVIWSTVEIAIKRSLDLAVRLILARLLFPEDFGLVGMAVVFTSFIEVLNDAGFGLALIQKKKEELTEVHYHTVFWAAIIWAFFLYTVIYFLISPLVAYFYQQPLLENVVRALSLPLLFKAVNTVHIAQLTKAMEFKKIAFVNNFSGLFSGLIAITLAFLDFGVWALIIYAVLSSFIAIPLYYRATRWKPKLIWNKNAFKDVFGFGVYTTTTKAVNNLSSNVDYLVIGKIISASALGTYTLAFMLTNLIKAQLTAMLNRVLYPFYSSIQADKQEIKKYYLKSLKYYGIVIFPMMALLILFGDYLIPLLFGNKWTETIRPMKILAFAVMVDVATSGYNLLFRSIGKPKVEMNIQLFVITVFLIPAVLIGVYLNGVEGVAYGILIANVLKTIYIQLCMKNYFSIGYKDIFSALSATAISVLSASLLVYFTAKTFAIIPSIMIVLFITLYGGLTYYFNKKEVLNLIKKRADVKK